MNAEKLQRIYDAAVALGAACRCGEKLKRFNPNHYGPGPNGGQFAPSGEGNNAPEQTAQVDEEEGEAVVGAAARRIIVQRAIDEKKISPEDGAQLLAQGDILDAARTQRFNALTGEVAGIPRGWTADEPDSAGGVYYRNSDKPQYDNVRIMPGNPQSLFPDQQNPYVIDQKSGRFLTKDGTLVPGRDSPGTHIPLENYRFDKR